MITLPDTRHHRLTPALGVGTVTVAVGLTALDGPVGIGGGVAIGLVTLGLGPVAGIAVGHLVAVALLGTPTTAELILFELSIAPLLATPLVERPSVGAAIVAGCAVLGVVAVGILARGSVATLWILAGGLTITLAVAGYTLHRYELVVLGLVPDELSSSAAGDR